MIFCNQKLFRANKLAHSSVLKFTFASFEFGMKNGRKENKTKRNELFDFELREKKKGKCKQKNGYNTTIIIFNYCFTLYIKGINNAFGIYRLNGIVINLTCTQKLVGCGHA